MMLAGNQLSSEIKAYFQSLRKCQHGLESRPHGCKELSVNYPLVASTTRGKRQT